MDGVDPRLTRILSRGWKLLLLRGIAAIAFGTLTWVRPGISLAALVFLFGAYALLDGILACWTAVTGHEDQEYWWALLLVGLIGIAVGVLTFSTPGVTALALLFYIAAWAIGTGVLAIVTGVRVREAIDGEWRLIFAGLASVLFGVLLMARPGAGALTVVWMIAAYAVTFGILLVLVAFRTRDAAGRAARLTRTGRPA
jgi:uncharacterized membrane protein HdeD (DUF308 family)